MAITQSVPGIVRNKPRTPDKGWQGFAPRQRNCLATLRRGSVEWGASMKRHWFSFAGRGLFCIAAVVCLAWDGTLQAGIAVTISTGDPDGKIATASRPGVGGSVETESADDFLLTAPTEFTSCTFTGLLPLGVAVADISQVVVEIYRVFPADSDTGRTPNVPTRVNSPSDVALATRDTQAGDLTFSTTLLNTSFTASNSVDSGIHPSPNNLTGGDGPVTGQEIRFHLTFTTPLDLPADHYFFVPQVLLSGQDDHFLWLSTPKPIVAPGTPFLPDLQSWIRNANLDPDWLRIGTDIVGGNTYNASFSLTGQAVPEPTSAFAWLLFIPLALAIRSRLGR